MFLLKNCWYKECVKTLCLAVATPASDAEIQKKIQEKGSLEEGLKYTVVSNSRKENIWISKCDFDYHFRWRY